MNLSQYKTNKTMKNNNNYLNSEFNKLVINSDKPYQIQFYDYYGNKTKYLSIDSEKLNKIIQIIKTN